jgi:hypothetical protein
MPCSSNDNGGFKKKNSILFKQNCINSSKDRTLMNAQWVSIGRASDIGGMSFSDIHWMDGFIIGDLTRRKVAKQQSLSVFPTPLVWEIDIFHSLGVQLVCDPFAVSNRLFNHFGHGADELKTAAYINRVMKVRTLYIKYCTTSYIMYFDYTVDYI